MSDEIERCGFVGFDILATGINHNSSGKAFYKGLARNVTSLKGINAHGLWIEEGESLSNMTLKVLTASIRVSAKDVAAAKLKAEQNNEEVIIAVPEIWVTMNRGSSSDPIAIRFLARAEQELKRCGYYEDDMCIIVQVNYTENPWFEYSGLETERADDKKHLSEDEYDHKWHGEYSDTIDGSIIKKKWFDAVIDAHKIERLKKVFEPHGAKIASHDPFNDGDDEAGYALRHGSIIKRIMARDHGEIDECCDWATGEAIKDGADWFVWDGDGMGTGLKRQVSLAFEGTKTKYHIFKGSASGKGQDNATDIYEPMYGDKDTEPKTYAETFKNNRAQYYIDLAKRCYNTYRCVVNNDYVDPDEMISIDSDGVDSIPVLRSQMCRIPRKPNANGLEQIMSKIEMKKQGISSPNESDSVMQSLFKPKVEIQFSPMNFESEF